MEESDIEGLATHDGPESCAGFREDVGEALTGDVQAGLLSREINAIGVPTLSKGRKATPQAALRASCTGTPRGRRTMACTEAPCARTGRAHRRPPPDQGRAARGRPRP
jgi:RNA-directed DNA polymerase